MAFQTSPDYAVIELHYILYPECWDIVLVSVMGPDWYGMEKFLRIEYDRPTIEKS